MQPTRRTARRPCDSVTLAAISDMGPEPQPHGGDRPAGRGWRELATRVERGDTYALVFILLIVTYFLVSLAPSTTWSRLLQELGAGATLHITLRTSHARARLQRLARLAVVVGFVLTLIGALVGGLVALVHLVFLGLLVVTPFVILNRILRHPSVNIETILGAVDVYVILGLMWAALYRFIAAVSGTPFFVQTNHASANQFPVLQFRHPDDGGVRRPDGRHQPRTLARRVRSPGGPDLPGDNSGPPGVQLRRRANGRAVGNLAEVGLPRIFRRVPPCSGASLRWAAPTHQRPRQPLARSRPPQRALGRADRWLLARATDRPTGASADSLRRAAHRQSSREPCPEPPTSAGGQQSWSLPTSPEAHPP